jgi:hypothetical protein
LLLAAATRNQTRLLVAYRCFVINFRTAGDGPKGIAKQRRVTYSGQLSSVGYQ